MNNKQNLELMIDKELTNVIYSALYSYWCNGGEQIREQVEKTDALELFRVASMYFQSEEPENEA